MKNNKITAEEQNADTNKLEKLWSERKSYGRKWLSTLVFQADECTLNIY